MPRMATVSMAMTTASVTHDRVFGLGEVGMTHDQGCVLGAVVTRDQGFVLGAVGVTRDRVSGSGAASGAPASARWMSARIWAADW